MKSRLFAIAASVLIATAPALGDGLKLNGKYGVSGGCEYEDGAMLSRGMSVLTATKFRAGEVTCDILEASQAPDETQVAMLLCSYPDQEGSKKVEFFQFSKPTDVMELDAIDMAEAGGKVLGRLEKCQ